MQGFPQDAEGSDLQVIILYWPQSRITSSVQLKSILTNRALKQRAQLSTTKRLKHPLELAIIAPKLQY